MNFTCCRAVALAARAHALSAAALCWHGHCVAYLQALLYYILQPSLHNIGQSCGQCFTYHDLQLSSQLRATLFSPTFCLLAHSLSVHTTSPSAPLLSYVVHTNQISNVYEAWLHYVMQPATMQVLLEPSLPSAFHSFISGGRERRV